MKYWAIIGILGLMGQALAQDTLRPVVTIGGRLLHGSIIAHSPELVPISQTHPQGVELNIDRLHNTEAAWQRCGCFARVGLSVSYITFNNPLILGSSWTSAAYFEPQLSLNHRLTFSLRAAAGLSYLTRVYDPQTNPVNTFFSSPISALLGIRFNVNLQLNHRWSVTASGQFGHISNGGLRLPNRGMNSPALGIGMDYRLTNSQLPNYHKFKLFPTDHRWRLRVLAFGTLKVLEASALFGQQVLPLWGAQLIASKPLARRYSVQGGAEAKLYDGFARATLNRQNQPTAHREVALLLGHELILGQFRFGQQFGLYVYQPYASQPDKIYHRHSLLYRTSGGWLLGVSLKAHRQVAEAFDLRLGKEW